jgi:hypothetical protein
MSIAERVVTALLEADEVDPKSFTDRHSDTIYNTWEQVDGDTDWWEYGGTFHNPGLGMLAHVDGLESAGAKDWSSWDIKLGPEDEAAILAQFPVNVDPEWPEGGDENERAREDATENRKQEIADQKNTARKVHVWRWTDDNIGDYADHVADVLNQTGMTEEQFSELPLGAQWAQIGQIIGYHEFDDYPDKYTEAEIKAYLTPLEDFRGRSRRQHSLPDEP